MTKLVVLLVLLLLCFEARHHQKKDVSIDALSFSPSLGQEYISFPTTAKSAAAQAHFLQGVAYLFNFWFGMANQEFRKASEIEPTFALAYWGEALTFFRNIWQMIFPAEGRRVIEKMNANIDIGALAPLEQCLVTSVVQLFENSTTVNIQRYLGQMEMCVSKFPESTEVKLLLVGGLFSLTLPENRGFLQRDVRALNRQKELLDDIGSNGKTSLHPGFLHFYIHAYDTPGIKGNQTVIDIARRYPQVARDSSHAHHMPSHLYLRLGMLKEAFEANQMSDYMSIHFIMMQKLDVSYRDFHSIEFMQYCAIHLGKLNFAKLVIQDLRQMYLKDTAAGKYYFQESSIMLTRYLVDTLDFSILVTNPNEYTLSVLGPVDESIPGEFLWANQVNLAILLTRGHSMIHLRENGVAFNQTAFDEVYSEMETIKDNVASRLPEMVNSIEAMKLQLDALHAQFILQDYPAARRFAMNASALEVSTNPPCYGPPLDFVKPSEELLAEILLLQSEYQQSLDHFQNVQTYFPNRVPTLLGIARCHQKLGNIQQAANVYNQLKVQLLGFDKQGLSWLQEAESFLEKTPVETTPGASILPWLGGAAIGIVATLTLSTVVLITIFVVTKMHSKKYNQL